MLQRLNGNSYEDSVTLIIILNGMTDSINPAYRRHCILGCLRIIAQIPTHAKTFSKKKCLVSHLTCHMSHVTCDKSFVTCHVSHVMCHMSHVTCHTSAYYWPSQFNWHVGHKTCIGQWRKKSHVFCVTCQVSYATCHLSPFMCPVSHVTCHICRAQMQNTNILL